MFLLRRIGTIVMWTLIYLALADVVGIVVCFLLETFSLSEQDSSVLYAIWFVLAVFCGLLIYQTAADAISPKGKGDWNTRPNASKTGFLVLLTASIVIALVALPCYRREWRYGMDSSALSLTFFVTTILSMIVFFFAFRPISDKERARRQELPDDDLG